MNKVVTSLLLALAAATASHGADAPVPMGRLPATVEPTAYRLELTVDPAEPAFSGHTEIDARLAEPARNVFLHGNGLRVSRVTASSGGSIVDARYTQVDPLGVARLDFERELAPGPLTLRFDYTADFRTTAEGLYRAQVGGDWYAWTQLEAIEARRVFPSFDEPGHKTPFTVTVTAPKDARVVANAPEAEATAAGALVVHRFATTKPLPTYLVAIGVGPFDVVETSAPPNAVRRTALPFRVIATKGQTPRMQLAAAEGPKLLALLEDYVGIAYPFEKLDFIASPIQGGAMENAGLIVYYDPLILLDANAPLAQVRNFGEVSAHEMAHQWFGDLVTPAWWTDIWLNESFAQWLGKKIADRWRPELGIATAELQEAFRAMSADALDQGRPMRQEITENRQIASAFDSITYEKGAQVLSMFESYLGSTQFQKGVRLHLDRYRYGNASSDDFFASLGEAASNDEVVPAVRRFTDQTGVPIVDVRDRGGTLTLTQQRYRPLGIEPGAPQLWSIPVCVARGDERACTLLKTATATMPAPRGSAPLLANANGSGYFRYRLDDAAWDRLIAAAATLPGRDALTVADSLWADFAAGTGSFTHVVAGAESLAANGEYHAAIELAARLKLVGDRLIAPAERPAYAALMRKIYGARLATLGVDLRAGAYDGEPIERQALRQALVPVLALEGRDPALRAQLAAAAAAYVAGEASVLDPAFRPTALAVAVQERGKPFMLDLKSKLVESSDPLFRGQASAALGAADTPELAETTLELASASDLQSFDGLIMIASLAGQPGARDVLAREAESHFQELAARVPPYARPRIIGLLFSDACADGDVERVEALVRPKLEDLGGGELELAQTKQAIGLCIALRTTKGSEIRTALASSGE